MMRARLEEGIEISVEVGKGISGHVALTGVKLKEILRSYE